MTVYSEKIHSLITTHSISFKQYPIYLSRYQSLMILELKFTMYKFRGSKRIDEIDGMESNR